MAAEPGARNRKNSHVHVIPRVPSLELEGLAAEWESMEDVRRQVLINRRLLQWLSTEKVGVPCFKTASMNYTVLEAFFRTWVTLSPTTKRTASQPACKKEAKRSLIAKHPLI